MFTEVTIYKYAKITLVLNEDTYSWLVNSGTYYGLALSASNLGGNPYYNYLISAAVEIPAYAFNLLVLNQPRVGRRLALAGCMLFAGVVLTITIFVPRDQTALLVCYELLYSESCTALHRSPCPCWASWPSPAATERCTSSVQSSTPLWSGNGLVM